MRNEFCTPVNVDYLPRALALYRSLEEVCERFRLRIFCMDERTKTLLDRLDLPSAEVISLDELEAHDPELRAVKPTRSPVEYCWTAIPAITLCSLERDPELEMITYLDADIMFFHDPAPLFDELGDAPISLTPHRYGAGAHTEHGFYDSTFMRFRRDERGLAALRWWRERCLEWCYDRFEDGKWSDINYLDDWPERFPGTHVLAHPGGGLAPWNSNNYDLRYRDGELAVGDMPVVFYHYGTLRFYRGGLVALAKSRLVRNFYRISRATGLVWGTPYQLGSLEQESIWEPYVARFAAALREIGRVEPTFSCGFARVAPADLGYQALRRLVPPALRQLVRVHSPGRLRFITRRRYRRA